MSLEYEPSSEQLLASYQRAFFIENLLVRIHFIIVMTRWTGLALWEFEFLFLGSLASTFLFLETVTSASARSGPMTAACAASTVPRRARISGS